MTDRGHKVLVVDDDLEMCGLLSDVLKGEAFSVITTHDSLEASKILKKEEFDVIKIRGQACDIAIPKLWLETGLLISPGP